MFKKRENFLPQGEIEKDPRTGRYQMFFEGGCCSQYRLCLIDGVPKVTDPSYHTYTANRIQFEWADVEDLFEVLYWYACKLHTEAYWSDRRDRTFKYRT